MMKQDTDRPTRKYILNTDTKYFRKSQIGTHRGVTLTKYYGTIQEALEKGVPIFDAKGMRTHEPPK